MRNTIRWSVAFLALTAAPAFAADNTLTITLAGQAMIRSDIRATNPAALPVLKGMLHGDVNFTNFEGTIFQEGQAVTTGRGFLAPAGAMDALQAVGFNLLAVADNHVFDLKGVGLANTMAALQARGIVNAGIGNSIDAAAAPAYLKTPKGTIALIASASGLMAPGARATANSAGVNELRIMAGETGNEANQELPAAPRNQVNREDAARILASIRAARPHADLVIAYQHNHVFSNRPFAAVYTEGMPERLVPPAWLKPWAHAQIDAGADIVVLHGAPVLHGVEIYHGKPIFYDLGNFIFNLPPAITYIDEPISWESVTADLTYEGGKLRAITLHPITMNTLGDGQPDVHDEHTTNQFLVTRGIPAPATGLRATDILTRLAKASAAFGTKVVLKGDAAEISLGH